MGTPVPTENHADAVLVGAGTMSTTLAAILKELVWTPRLTEDFLHEAFPMSIVAFSF